MIRIPFWSSVIVLVAVAAMVALGVWQLQRMREKEAALAVWQRNTALPVTAYPAARSTDPAYLFRSVSAYCLRVVDWQVLGGRLPDGQPGWRHIAQCASGAEGPGFAVDIGTGADPNRLSDWRGGEVSGIATWEPDGSSALARWLGGGPPRRLMIVSDRPAPGLVASAPPDPAKVPNNHLSYAVQWFGFAAVALVIYVLALWRRQRSGG